ncbi:ATP-binding cassette domain-containing protein [Candidatus Parcubacteria bacterium]|nr:ATP-binding cassette domain-containing protein [Patescibacteria group bacterium]MBU4309057.1 ATP-binding cassette domain-containing protein [Patescibacteria group bacterium]MBU4432434.1 ATP-binding cassette domain-containing protein [Patescibacteria group bacterium]MBU4577418.1 ATP-binding cassette domain-containing protein [Patescibacteria group bacterium]MCG2697106.1 ATP-binding cassette domain-containing protein [Candidatus Parcubacteria bacterium]
MKNTIQIKNATANNLKNVSVAIPLNKLVVVAGKSGSGKSSLIYDVLFKASQGERVAAVIGKLPKTFAISQKVKSDGKMSLGETNMGKLREILKVIKKDELLIIDEPCAGMNKVDRESVLKLLRDSLKKGISIIVVEHNKDIIANADYVIEFGPEAGAKGGEVIFQGSIADYKKAKTPTSIYVFSKKAELVDYQRSPNAKAKLMQKKSLIIKGINQNNIKNYNLNIPLGSLVCMTGGIGTGKTTLLSVAYGSLFKGKDAWKMKQGFKSIEGKANVRRSYFVDQTILSPIITSTPATYLGIWDSIRDVFGGLPESKKLKLNKSHFSLNTQFGKEKIHVLEKVKYKNKTIFDVLKMTIDEATILFDDNSLVKRKLGFLQEVGLGYLALGQKSGTLSGGEAQRVRLAKILSKKLGDRCIYILDIPSRGLHLSDLPTLTKIFQKIIDKNNTVLIAENREEIINNCDAVINL